MRRDKVLREIGHRIQRERHRLKISQEELAERAGLHRTYAGFLERGERTPSAITLIRIATALEVDPAVLVQGLRVGRKETD